MTKDTLADKMTATIAHELRCGQAAGRVEEGVATAAGPCLIMLVDDICYVIEVHTVKRGTE